MKIFQKKNYLFRSQGMVIFFPSASGRAELVPAANRKWKFYADAGSIPRPSDDVH